MGNATSKIPGIKFEKQEDGSVFVGGRSAKGSYVVKATELSRSPVFVSKPFSDTRLPKKGPGRAPNDGNFVLTELEVQARPVADLKKWTKVKEWFFDELAENKDWQGAYGAKTGPGSWGLAITGNLVEGVLSIGEFFTPVLS